MKLTAIILAKNEEQNIADCITCLEFCDEILVLDDGSTDNTEEIAKRTSSKVQVIGHPLEDFSLQRNFALQKSTGDWVLFVDADERISKRLADEIRTAVVSTDTKGFYLRRQDYMWGKELKYGETAQIRLLRLARRDAGKWKGRVHEIWEVTGSTDELFAALDHYPHQTLTEFIGEVNIYSTLRAQELYVHKVKTNAFLILLYPKAKFICNYILKKGYKDGVEGFIVAAMMSLHSFLVRGKLYLLWKGIKST